MLLELMGVGYVAHGQSLREFLECCKLSVVIYYVDVYYEAHETGNVPGADAFQKRIGLRVKELRMARHISQESFAALCSLHRTHMSMVERGKLNLTVNTLKMILDALGVKASEFFEGME